MVRTPQLRLHVLTALIFTLILASCTPAYSAKPTANEITTPPTSMPLATNTTAPTDTPTETPITPTPTPEPTADPRELAGLYGLDPGRTYERRTVTGTDGAEHDALVDAYNQSPKVVFADGGAVRLDESDPEQLELMWGHLVPEGEEYIMV